MSHMEPGTCPGDARGLAGGDACATMAINFGARNIAGFAGDARRFRKHTTKESN